jgi:cytochrome b subunit of formate dehydrogenase
MLFDGLDAITNLMEKIQEFYIWFNLIFGAVMILIGTGLYKPNFNEKGKAMLIRYRKLVIFFGALMVVVSLFRLIF